MLARTSIQTLIESLKNDTPLYLNKNGEWQPKKSSSFIHQLFSCPMNEILFKTLTSTFCKILDTLEKIPVVFDCDEKTTRSQKTFFSDYITAGKLIEKKLASFNTSSIEKNRLVLKQKLVGLQYRIEEAHGGFHHDTPFNKENFNQLVLLATRWKKNQFLYPDKKKSLSARDINKLFSTCFYSEFVELLLEDKKYSDIFFKWAIRDNNGISQFIEFPATCERLRFCFIDKRIGYFNPNELSIKKIKNESGQIEKLICLPFFNGKDVIRVSILDESRKVTLSQNWELTLQEIFSWFHNKKRTPGRVEYFGSTGINNWCNHETAYWNPQLNQYHYIDLNQEEWWNKLPIHQTVSKEDLQNRYNITVKEGNWVMSVLSTRESLKYSAKGTHAYIECAVPFNDQYIIYPFGKYIEHFPTKFFEELIVSVKTETGKIGYPDENPAYSHRQHASHSTEISSEAGMKLMRSIKDDIIQSRKGLLHFQLLGENCAKWAETKKEITGTSTEIKPFKIHLSELKPNHSVTDFLLTIPDFFEPYFQIQSFLLYWAQFAADVYGKEDSLGNYKSTFFSDRFDKQLHYQPDRLPKMIASGKLPGKLSFGN